MAIDLTNGYDELRQHVGHEIEIAEYGRRGRPFDGGDLRVPWNVAIECVTCYEILLDFDHPNAEANDDPQ